MQKAASCCNLFEQQRGFVRNNVKKCECSTQNLTDVYVEKNGVFLCNFTICTVANNNTDVLTPKRSRGKINLLFVFNAN